MHLAQSVQDNPLTIQQICRDIQRDLNLAQKRGKKGGCAETELDSQRGDSTDSEEDKMLQAEEQKMQDCLLGYFQFCKRPSTAARIKNRINYVQTQDLLQEAESFCQTPKLSRKSS